MRTLNFNDHQLEDRKRVDYKERHNYMLSQYTQVQGERMGKGLSSKFN